MSARNRGWLTLFGLGYVKYSASIASVLAILCYVAARQTGVTWMPYILLGIALLATVLLSLARASYTATDPREAVVDEFLAMLTCCVVANTANTVALISLLVAFRLLDILKPFPISIIDERMHGPLGYLVDDIAICAPLGLVAAFIPGIHA